MTIDELIAAEAGADTAHDSAYAAALRVAWDRYKDMDPERFRREQAAARARYGHNGATHMATAECVVLMKLIDGVME